jgi:hypothetical protein
LTILAESVERKRLRDGEREKLRDLETEREKAKIRKTGMYGCMIGCPRTLSKDV